MPGISSRLANASKLSRMAEWKKYSLGDLESIQQWRHNIANDSGLGQNFQGRIDEPFQANPDEVSTHDDLNSPSSGRVEEITDLSHRNLVSEFSLTGAPIYGRIEGASHVSPSLPSFGYQNRSIEGLNDNVIERVSSILDDNGLGNREAQDTGTFQGHTNSWNMSPASQSQVAEQSPVTTGDQQLPQSERLAQAMHDIYY
ncbi:hypothetical protein PVAG01_09485 [Phlyctema vagabunda]|uniref:Uncharacterized protein n=1 Tax=Phlyctema vagabunda TaxID=108571 RepID=A0ABR4P7H8_9HELO